jgi:hypothetical protein
MHKSHNVKHEQFPHRSPVDANRCDKCYIKDCVMTTANRHGRNVCILLIRPCSGVNLSIHAESIHANMRTYTILDTAMSSALAADVTAMLHETKVSVFIIRTTGVTHKTTSKSAIAPPFPINTAAAAGAANPALVCCAERGNGYVGNKG